MVSVNHESCIMSSMFFCIDTPHGTVKLLNPHFQSLIQETEIHQTKYRLENSNNLSTFVPGSACHQ